MPSSGRSTSHRARCSTRCTPWCATSAGSCSCATPRRRRPHFHDDYVYFSSFSTSWLEHARRYVTAMTERFDLTPASSVMEMCQQRRLPAPVLPTRTACRAWASSPPPIPARRPAPRASTAANCSSASAPRAALRVEGWQVDLLLGNNVLAHVPDINDFVGGMPIVLKPEGVITLEFRTCCACWSRTSSTRSTTSITPTCR